MQTLEVVGNEPALLAQHLCNSVVCPIKAVGQASEEP